MDISPTALTRLNRALAISYRSGPRAALPLVEELRDVGELPHSYVVTAALANLLGRAFHATCGAVAGPAFRRPTPDARPLPHVQSSPSK